MVFVRRSEAERVGLGWDVYKCCNVVLINTVTCSRLYRDEDLLVLDDDHIDEGWGDDYVTT